MLTKAGVFSTSLVAGLLMFGACTAPAFGKVPQAQAAAPEAMTRALGTVKAITGNSLTIATDKGEQVVVSVPDGARILQLAPGSTNLKDAQTIPLTGVSVGDRILATGKAGNSAGTLTALRVILMKSTAIAEKRATEEADWQKRGMGGIVAAVDPATGTLAVLEGTKKIAVHTSGSTIFRRYAGDSVKFEDAVSSSFAQVHAGDQLRARGARSDDGLSLQADEVVSGSFKNLSGLIKTIDAADGTLTLKDLATKRTMTVKVTANSNVHTLPPQAAMMFAARARGTVAAGGQRRGAGQPEGARPEGARPEGGRGEGSMGARGSGNAGASLSQLVNRLPLETIADLKVGDAVMVVASESDPASSQVTAITLLSGVEPILQAAPSGSSDMTLSPWDVSGSAPDMGGAQQQ